MKGWDFLVWHEDEPVAFKQLTLTRERVGDAYEPACVTVDGRHLSGPVRVVARHGDGREVTLMGAVTPAA